VVTATCLAIPLAPRFWTVVVAGLVGAMAGVTIGPTLAAISLGVVGPDRFARRAGRNEALYHAGDGAISLAILLAAPFLGNPVLFWTMGFTAIASVAAAAAVPAGAINHDVARGLLPGDAADGARPSVWACCWAPGPCWCSRPAAPCSTWPTPPCWGWWGRSSRKRTSARASR
jgi:hypothetical protein